MKILKNEAPLEALSDGIYSPEPVGTAGFRAANPGTMCSDGPLGLNPAHITGAAMDKRRQTLRGIYTAEIGVRELTSKNDGPWVQQ